jgi:predicted metal-dependent enzyme (double-stranded beta helix superfamily)
MSLGSLSPAFSPAVPADPRIAPLVAVTATRPAGSAALAVSLALRTELWEPLVRFQESSRWTALLAPDDVRQFLDPSLHAELDEAQIWLLSWLPEQGTPLHDHGGSAGAFAVARGTLTERVVATGGLDRPRATQTDLPAGRVRFFGAHHVHQVTNRSAEPAVSVHVYAPRLTEMNTYRVDGAALVRTGTERAGVDW